MEDIYRREFLAGLAATASLAGCGTLPSPNRNDVRRRLTTAVAVETGKPLRALRPDSLGFSFEQQLVGDPTVFTPDNRSLVSLMRGLGAQGTLRVGGNSTELGLWCRDATTPRKPYRYALTPNDLARLNEFLQETGWKVLYSINLANGEPERAADEAWFAQRILGDRLAGFQIGNEPDVYRHIGIRNRDYGVEEYGREWLALVHAVRGRVKNAVFTGPDIVLSAVWIRDFVKKYGDEVAFLSAHYYSTGPAKRADISIPVMFDGETANRRAVTLAAAFAAVTDKPIRITEGNSCSKGGKKGVSDVFASALWGSAQWFDLMALGYEGLNFHGGKETRYTPVAQAFRSRDFVPRPLYYGMLFCAQALPGTLVASHRGDEDALLRDFAVLGADGREKVILINQHADTDYTVLVTAERPIGSARALRLSAPDLEARRAVRLGDAPVNGRGEWTGGRFEPLETRDGLVAIDVPAASAVMVDFA